jgi:carbonic anhydrase
VHGWVYSLHDGRVRELGMDVKRTDDLEPTYAAAIRHLGQREVTA